MSVIYFITTQDINTFQKNYLKRYFMILIYRFQNYLTDGIPR